MSNNEIVSRDEWIEARRALLAEEKELTRKRDELSAKRRALPWRKIEQDYRFVGAEGELTLADLFDGYKQLIVYHFMFGPDWEKGCKSCSFMTDHVQLAVDHLAQRDVAYVAVSRAPLAKLDAFKERMGWRNRWVSSEGSTFNFDFDVSFEQEQLDAGEAVYNYEKKKFPTTEAPGLSVFIRDDDGQIFHTYSAFARGLDPLIGTYNWLDLLPLGRGEDDDPYPMAWVRLRDEYGT